VFIKLPHIHVKLCQKYSLQICILDRNIRSNISKLMIAGLPATYLTFVSSRWR